MPYVDEGTANYPKGIYQKPESKADAKWLSNIKANLKDNTSVTEIQSVNAFNSFYPMEVIATASETSALVAKNNENSFLVFPEDREHSIKLKSDLPQRWIQKKQPQWNMARLPTGKTTASKNTPPTSASPTRKATGSRARPRSTPPLVRRW